MQYEPLPRLLIAFNIHTHKTEPKFVRNRIDTIATNQLVFICNPALKYAFYACFANFVSASAGFKIYTNK